MNLSWLLPAGHGIPVLMYHRVWPGLTDDLTITPQNLREHWDFLKKNGYHTLSLPEYLTVVNGDGRFPEKAILLTFDDGYRNNFEYVYPLLGEFGWKATFFIIARSLHMLEEGDSGFVDQKMTLEELQQLDPATVQLGMHGYAHEDFSSIDLPALRDALQRSINAFEDSGLPFHKVFAYPYGARPADQELFLQLKDLMSDLGIAAAFRIGNKVSEVPARDIYEIKRIDIKGSDTVDTLAIKLKKGKLKPF